MKSESNRTLAAEFLHMYNLINALGKNHVNPKIDALAGELGITHQRLSVLYGLSMEKDQSLKDLSHTLGVSSSSLSIMIDNLVEMGMVSRVQDTEDRRRVVMSLTPRGQEVMETTRNMVLDHLEEWVESFNPEKKALFEQSVGGLTRLLTGR